ncbi:hypothetical protein QE152_g5230 [Popillia japonica]|uniref:Retroviral polymerase SH3-like domain-containing protein n=1 Tax=Popillia japonica TaxID=7064 RepID=A0AAW1MP91_POPJA
MLFVMGFRCIDPVTKKITISRDVVFFENPASTVVAEELDDSDSVRDVSLGESSTNGTENINHDVISNDTLESADDRDDVEHTLVDDPDFEPDVPISMPVRLRQSSRERRPVRHDDYVTYLTVNNEIGTDPVSFNDATSSVNQAHWKRAMYNLLACRYRQMWSNQTKADKSLLNSFEILDKNLYL